LLNILHAISQYNAIRAHPTQDWRPRIKIFAGKAAPSYILAKQIIRLAHDVARVINGDPTVRGLLQVAFMPNYNVSLAELLIPAADLSEQISTAGMEASGTGNMKLALNGALTIGTLDGANVEIRERVGAENLFIFGMTTEEVEVRRHAHGLDATGVINACPALRDVIEALRGGVFSPEEPGRYAALADRLTHADPFFVCADFDSYDRAQEAVDAKWRDPASWWRSAVLNTAHMAWFSSDRTIGEYAEGTWGVRGS
jgi:starch phosphorylase